MSDVYPANIVACIFLLTYLAHSSLAVLFTLAFAGLRKRVTNPELRVQAGKLALILPIITSLAVTTFEVPHFGLELPVPADLIVNDAASAVVPAPAAAPLPATVSSGLQQNAQITSADFAEPASLAIHTASEVPITVSPNDRPHSSTFNQPIHRSWIWFLLPAAWAVTAAAGLLRLFVQWQRLRGIRHRATPVQDLTLVAATERLRRQLNIRQRVALLRSSEIQGPLTAGVVAPYILLPDQLVFVEASPGEVSAGGNAAVTDLVNSVERVSSVAERDALLAHELVHIARGDAKWNLLSQFLCRILPWQPLNRLACRRLRKDMDFVADAQAARTLQDRTGLAQCLVRMAGHRRETSAVAVLAAGMASFRSPLGRRVEALLSPDTDLRPCSSSARRSLAALMMAGAILAMSVGPRAIAFSSTSDLEVSTRNPSMNRTISAAAVLMSLAMPVVADEPSQSSTAGAASAPLKTTPDTLPAGMKGFNGMLVGRVAARDIEQGTFVVQVDAVSRVWRNSGVSDPKSVVGKTVQISGVFGKFLDVLVVTRIGETVEFECKHDGDGLVFPGELLRKVAAFDPQDYPVLPESFRGFEGAVAADVVKKDPETFELIVRVKRVTDTWKSNKARQPSSIEGKPMMLAGFWNRKDAYHKIKVGDQIQVGMRHIGLRSDHLTVAEFVRSGATAEPEMKKEEEGRMKKDSPQGFRGMLVGRLVEKDIERGTFTVTVDAVPRVWKNNTAGNPKSLKGTNVVAEGVTGKHLDVLVVTRLGETIEFGALQEDGDQMRVVEVLRKVSPVKPGDYPELPDAFRGFKGLLRAEVVRKDDHLLDMVVQVSEVKETFPASQAKEPGVITGKQVMLAGFWKRKEAFHSISVGDTIEFGVEHPQRMSDVLSVIESVRKVESR